MPSTDDYLEQIAATAESTPRSPGGLRLNLTISLYQKGHSGLDAKGATGIPMNNDEELARSLRALVEKLRARI